jgi:hypothetical protein
LGDKGEDADGETINIGTVATDELDLGVLETKEKFCVARQPIQFCDHENRPQLTADAKCVVQLRTVGVGLSATLDLGKLTHEGELVPTDVAEDDLPLGGEAEA